MCCIFTCCGWMIDLIQRLWIFVMSCCMCSAVCMSVMTASMSGIAMGYNYSLAEYIDMKETNVSVFLKRGIFDDDLGADMGFRRAGHGPVSGLIKESDLITAEPEEVVLPKESGRRLDDTVLQSNDNNNFEGSLMKLTAKPPAFTETPSTYRGDQEMGEVLNKYPTNSLDQLKAIQSLMNMRKNNQQRLTVDYDKTTMAAGSTVHLGRRGNDPIELESPQRRNIYMDKAAIPVEHFKVMRNPARAAVPPLNIGASEHWLLPKDVEEAMGRTLFFTDHYVDGPFTPHTYPTPIRYKTDVVRPTLTTSAAKFSPLGPDETPNRGDYRRLDDSGVHIKNKLLMDKAMFPSFKKVDSAKSESAENYKSNEIDYEEEAKRGIRVRKKRNINKFSKGVIVEETHYTPPNILFNKYLKVESDRTPKKIHINDGKSMHPRLIIKNNSTTNTSSNTTTTYNRKSRDNITQSDNAEYTSKSKSDVIGDALDFTKKDKYGEFESILFNKLNHSYSTTEEVKLKPNAPVVSFLKTLFN